MQYKRQAGATLVEAIYILPIFFSIVFGMMEMTFVYKAKNTLNLATQEAVRKGSFNHATQKSIEDALYKGMAPLYAARESCQENIPLNGLVPGNECARRVQDAINGKTTGKFKTTVILSPSKEIYKKFEVNHNIKLPGVAGGQHQQKYMPNDNLKWRNSNTVPVTIGGESHQINIQDANLLKIKTFWCQKLSVPGLDLVLYNTILRHSKSPEQYYCNKLSQDSGNEATSVVFERSRGYYIAIKSHAIARMQSAVLESTYNSSLLSSDQIVSINNPSIPDDSEPPIIVNPPGNENGGDGNGDDGNGDDGNGDDGNGGGGDDGGGDDGDGNGDDGNGGDDGNDDDDHNCPDGQIWGDISGCHDPCSPTNPEGCQCDKNGDPIFPNSPAPQFTPITNQ